MNANTAPMTAEIRSLCPRLRLNAVFNQRRRYAHIPLFLLENERDALAYLRQCAFRLPDSCAEFLERGFKRLKTASLWVWVWHGPIIREQILGRVKCWNAPCSNITAGISMPRIETAASRFPLSIQRRGPYL